MSSFRKRKQPIINSCFDDVRFDVHRVDDEEVISQVTCSSPVLPCLSPTLDEQLKAGVSIKEVPTNGVLDSYDVNDTPLENFEEKIVSKGLKTKKVESKDNE